MPEANTRTHPLTVLTQSRARADEERKEKRAKPFFYKQY
jgi:hypothetical protein